MGEPSPPRWSLTLYVHGTSPRSAEAIDNVSRICETELDGLVDLEIIDLRDTPAAVLPDDVIAVPTLVRRWPLPVRRLVGGLSDMTRLHLALDLDVGAADGDDGG